RSPRCRLRGVSSPTPLGIRPPIVRQWKRCVGVIVRWQTTGPDNLADHNCVIAAIVHAVGGALEPDQRAVDQRCPAEWAGNMWDLVKLTEQVASAVGEVSGKWLLVDGQQ